MFGRLMECVRAIALPCLMVMAMTTTSFGATFRFDPISVTNPPTPPVTLQAYEDYRFGRAVYNDPLFNDSLSSIRPVRFQVKRILTPVTKVTLRVYVTHQHLNDLTMSLTSPDGITVRLFSRIGQLSDPPVAMNAGGLGQFVEFTSDEIPTPPSITAATSLTNNGSFVAAGHYQPEENLGKFNGMTTNANGVWSLAIDDSVTNYSTGFFYSARLYITQVGGDHVWTGTGADANWSTAANWEPLFGPPEADQINTLSFPSVASSFVPVNNFSNPRGSANVGIVTIAATDYPTLPFTVPAVGSADQIVISIASPEPNRVIAAWIAVTSAARIGDSIIINDNVLPVIERTFRIVDVTNTITSHTLTVTRIGQIGTGTVQTTGHTFNPVTATMILTRSLNELDISAVNFYGQGYNVIGSPVRATDRATFYNANGSNIWTLNTEIEEGELILSSANGALRMTGVVSGGGGVTKIGIGNAELAGNNSFLGANTIKAGILDISNSGALGALGIARNTVIRDGGTVRVAQGLTVNEDITIDGIGSPALLPSALGALAFSGPAATTWNGLITLKVNGTSSVSVLTGAAVTLSNIAPKTAAASALTYYQLSVANAGTLAINSPLPTLTRLSISGGATTCGSFSQSNIADLTLNGASLTSTVGMTVSNSISSVASSTSSVLAGILDLAGTSHGINVEGGPAGAGGNTNMTSSDLVLSATTTNGSFTKTGGGVLRISNAAGVGATVNEGTLAGTGAIGSIAVATGANLSPAGTWTVGSTVSMATGSALILPTGATPRINATGVVTLDAGGASGGLSGAILQPYSGAGSTIITALSVTGIFNGTTNGVGITYNSNNVILAAFSGRTLSFSPIAYTANEGSGSVQVTVVWTGGVGSPAPLLRSFGGGVKNNLDLQFIGLVGSLSGNTLTYTLPIVDNHIQSGDQTTNLAIVPQDGSLVTNSATLTIIDNDRTDKKKCGLGTGLTVFFLLAFGLLFGLRLRRP